MSVLLNIHHVRFAVKDVGKFLQLLRVQLQFSSFAARCNCSSSLRSESMVVKHQDVIFIIDQLEGNCDKNDRDFCWGNSNYSVNTACDVCLECSDIETTLESASLYDKNCVLTGLTTIEDEFGVVKYAVVKPPVGNVQHTLVDLSEYHGPFLPGFKLISNSDTAVDKPKYRPDLIQAIDHIAYALNIGETKVVMQWYLDCMKFSRLIINVDEDEEEGFVVKQGVKGLRLKAIFAPLNSKNRCDEPLSENQSDVPKFVFGEALNNDFQSDQVSHFLHMHQGPGVQHIAFGTKDIVATVSHFKEQGLSCVLPPTSYYNEVAKNQEIQKLKYEVETLKTNSILLESHLTLSESVLANSSYNAGSLEIEDQIQKMNNTRWFIMQVFTSPVFPEKTLFFEIIQRFQTMSAFGAGNISGLWRAVQNELFCKS